MFSKTNDDGTAATKAILFAGSALRVGNVLLYFLLPHEHVRSYPQARLPAAVVRRRAELVEAFKAQAPATDAGGSKGGADGPSATAAPTEAGTPAAASTAKLMGDSTKARPGPGSHPDPAATAAATAAAPAPAPAPAPLAPSPGLMQSGSEASPSGPSVQGAASAASDSAPPAMQRPAVSPQLPESAPAPDASRASSSPADDDSSKAGKTPANNSGMTYRQILDLVISSLPPGRWSARDLCNRAVQLLPEGSVTNRTAFSASFKNVLKGLDRFPGDLSAEEHAAAVARGNKRISGALWYVTGPNDVQAALPPHTQAALAARIAELANSGDGFLTAKAGGAPLEAPAAAAAAAASAAGTPAEDRAAKRQREVEDQGQPADAESPAAEAAGVAEPEPKRKPEPPTAVLDGEGGFSL